MNTSELVKDYTDISKILVKLKCKDGLEIYVDKKMLKEWSLLFANLFSDCKYNNETIPLSLFDSDIVCFTFNIFTRINKKIYYITPEFAVKMLEFIDYLDIINIYENIHYIDDNGNKHNGNYLEYIMDCVVGYDIYILYNDLHIKDSLNIIKNVSNAIENTDKMMKEFLNLNIFEELKDKKLSSMFHRVCFNFFVTS